MNTPAIVLPVRNRAHCVLQTLDSIAASTLLPAQLIIVDNGSTDDSLAVCNEWARRHQADGIDIRVISEPHPGANVARNRGLAECTATYVAFFDSDDHFDPGAIADITAALDAWQAPADLLFLPVLQETGGKTRTRYYHQTDSPATHILTSMLSTQSMVFRTAWLRDLGGWDEQLTVWQDWELGLRALLHAPRIHWLTDRPYHRILVHPDSITGTSFTQTLDGTLLTMRAALDDIRKWDTSQPSPTTTTTELDHRRDQALTALYLRAMLMSGHLRREHNPEGAAAYRNLASIILPHPARPLRLLGTMLSNYTALGLRGAWRIALACV